MLQYVPSMSDDEIRGFDPQHDGEFSTLCLLLESPISFILDDTKTAYPSEWHVNWNVPIESRDHFQGRLGEISSIFCLTSQ